MKKSEYLSRLEGCLKEKGIPDGEIPDILSIYGEHFTAGAEEGKTEEEIAARLGDPVQIAMEYLEDKPAAGTGIRECMKSISSKIKKNGVKSIPVIIPGFLVLILIIMVWMAVVGIILFGGFGIYAGIAKLVTGAVPGFVSLIIYDNAETFIIILSLGLISAGGLGCIGLYSVVKTYLGFLDKQLA
jgi:uncharacterized membrane protein